MGQETPARLAIDLFCGLGGWAEGFLAESYSVIGFDNGECGRDLLQRYPGQLVIQDVLTLDGSQFRNAAVIVASPPCQAYSYRAMPWKRAKALPPPSNDLFDACFRIQREACEAAGRHIPLVVENVKGAQPWVGRAQAHFGSYFLWGDIAQIGNRIVRRDARWAPQSLPIPSRTPMKDSVTHRSNGATNFHGVKAGDRCIDRTTGKWTTGWNVLNARRFKNNGGSWFAIGSPGQKQTLGNPVNGTKAPSGSGRRTDKGNGVRFTSRDCGIEGVKQHGSGPAWFDTGIAKHGSRTNARKLASAMIAKIPFPLAQHIARVYR